MKTILVLWSFVFGYSLAAQVVHIPDQNFKDYLIKHELINTNRDDEIQVSEAVGFKGFIDCGGRGISDLTGIEMFKSLTLLACASNSLTSLDLSQNTAFKYLYLDRGWLTAIP